MIHTFTIENVEGTYDVTCDTCGERSTHWRVRDMAVGQGRSHARNEHGARDVAGESTAWERLLPDDGDDVDPSMTPAGPAPDGLGDPNRRPSANRLPARPRRTRTRRPR